MGKMTWEAGKIGKSKSTFLVKLILLLNANICMVIHVKLYLENCSIFKPTNTGLLSKSATYDWQIHGDILNFDQFISFYQSWLL